MIGKSVKKKYHAGMPFIEVWMKLKYFLDCALVVKQNTEYETEIRQFAVSLHISSPAAYIFVCEWMGGLPSISTIRMWSGIITLNPGFIEISFDHLRAMSEVDIHDKGDKSVVNVKIIRAAISKKSFELLGCNLDVYGDFAPYFKYPVTSKQVCCMLDPSHNIKCIKNIISTSKAGIMSPKGRISWKFFEHLNLGN